MANKKLPGGRKSAGQVSASVLSLVNLNNDATGVPISELPAADELTGKERFPVVQQKETRGATIEQITSLIPAGDNGLSAYQIWLNAGNEGTEDDFLKWLQVSASVTIDPLDTNIIKQNADGLYANGAHPVIPKFSTTTLTGLLDSFKSMLDGTRVYTMSASITNPLKIAQLGGVSVQRYISIEPQYYYTNETGEYIPAQYFVTGAEITASTIKVTVSVVMASKPQRSWDLSTLGALGNADEGDLQCRIAIKVLMGTTLSQNGMS